jgi:hypothetical protein
LSLNTIDDGLRLKNPDFQLRDVGASAPCVSFKRKPRSVRWRQPTIDVDFVSTVPGSGVVAGADAIGETAFGDGVDTVDFAGVLLSVGTATVTDPGVAACVSFEESRIATNSPAAPIVSISIAIGSDQTFAGDGFFSAFAAFFGATDFFPAIRVLLLLGESGASAVPGPVVNG